MAAKPPPPPLVDPGYNAGDRLDKYPLAPVGVLLGFACITTGLRLYWRVRPARRIGADDYTLVFALVRTAESDSIATLTSIAADSHHRLVWS